MQQHRPGLTEAELTRDLRSLGVPSGSTLVVHASLSKVGWVADGPKTVLAALIATVGAEGTLVMPAATPACGDPATWAGPEVTEAELERLREHTPVFDLRTTPTTLGAIPETFRTWPDVLRSDHPLESVSARGPLARRITAHHPLEFSEGPGSPFGKLHELDGRILLLGVGFDRCTALHYAESLACNRRTQRVRLPTLRDGRRAWVEVDNVADDNGTHFPSIGERFTRAGLATVGQVGRAPSILCSMRALTDFAVRYFETELPTPG
jgi:aminoglycoside 3-N-acetyltransferase